MIRISKGLLYCMCSNGWYIRSIDLCKITRILSHTNACTRSRIFLTLRLSTFALPEFGSRWQDLTVVRGREGARLMLMPCSLAGCYGVKVNKHPPRLPVFTLVIPNPTNFTLRTYQRRRASFIPLLHPE